MRSERFVPVSDILPRISATVIVLNYNAMLSAEQLSVLCNSRYAPGCYTKQAIVTPELDLREY